MRLHHSGGIDIHITLDAPIASQLVAILQSILERITAMSQAIDDLKAQVTAIAGVQESAIALIQGLHDQLEEAVNSGDMAAVQEVTAQLAAQKEALAAAVAANQPPTA